MSPSLGWSIRARDSWAGWMAVGAFALWPTLSALAWVVPLPAALNRVGSQEIRYSDGSAAWLSLSADEQWRVPIPVSEVDPAYVEALLQIEDSRFWIHPGVDPIAVARAAVQNLRRGEVISGASTLTMQVARMSEPRPRTLPSKALDALRALQMELRRPKEETLATYLALAPYGRNIQGVEAASLWMFGHTSTDLSPAEIATLLAIPQDPNDRFPSPRNRARLTLARDAIARRLWSEPTLSSVLDTPVPTEFAAVPREIPHAASWINALGTPGSAGSSQARVVRTTLDRGVQRVASRTLAGASAELHLRGIHNGAILVAEHATGRLRALAGLDGMSKWPGAQIAPFGEPRSPGSTLKPVLYALAIDRGLIRPASLVADVPAHYRSYSPENYDHQWSGMVRMDEALSRSLNVPFVNLLSKFGVESFLGTLRAAGSRHLSPVPGTYGLSAIVGGVEITPIELAQLFMAIAEDGRLRPITVREDQRPSAAIRLYSAGAAWLTRDTLRLRDRPDFPSRSKLASIPQRIHWKTGTSFGNRDAWAVGSGTRYTVVVWLGNFDQTPAAGLIGADVAAPLLFDTLEGLQDGPPSNSTGDDLPPDEVGYVSACALSGEAAGAGCPQARVLALAGRAPRTACPLHVTALVDPATGQRVGPGCAPDSTTSGTFVAWPANVARYLGDRLMAEPTLPAWSPRCGMSTTGGPRVLTPGENQRIMLIPGMRTSDQEVALEADGEGELVWYVDGKLLARGPAGERQWWTPEAGAHTLTVMDASGATASRALAVHGRSP
ncbi:MAG: penicillin-binding protein 1C [Myxococcales bacterium]|nr:penicillin-binding protein 1C [Myxococcales bacterium]